EGVRGDLDQTGLGQRSVRGATGALGPGEAATAGGGGQERGDRLVPDQAGDLLDQVRTDGQIGAPRGRGDGEGALGAVLDLAADHGQAGAHLLRGVGDADHALGVAERERDRGGRGRRAALVRDGGRDLAAAVLDDQLGGAVCGGEREL